MNTHTAPVFVTFRNAPKRRFIAAAVGIVRDNMLKALETTAIVLPPRYGKSNAIRLTALELVETGLATAVVVLAPWVVLRNQLLQKKRIDRMIKQMGVRVSPVVSRLDGNSIQPRFWEKTGKRCHLFAMTIAAAHQPASLLILKDAARYCRDVLGKPLVVMIDEAHTVAMRTDGGTGWGDVALELKQCGAHIVLFTGTPERSDNIAPFGFRVTEKKRKKGVEASLFGGTRTDPAGKVWRKMLRVSGDKVEYELDADLVVPFDEAFNNTILLRAKVVWFSCKADGERLEDIDKNGGARSALGAASRDDEVIREGAALAVEDIAERRIVNGNSACLVFTGNDQAEDEHRNFHPKRVLAILKDEWKKRFGYSPDIAIATLDEFGDGSKASEIIGRFVGSGGDVEDGIGDILIVKQMGGVGLDVPRVKTILDLSSVRARSNWLQRMCRVLTPWEGVSHGTLVLPRDQLSQELWADFEKAGGGFTVFEATTIIDTSEFEEGDQNSHSITITDPEAAGVSDMHGNHVAEPDMARVRRAKREYPEIAGLLETVIWSLILQGALPEKPEPQNSEPPVETENLSDECETLRRSVNGLVKQLVMNDGVRYDENNSTSWVEAHGAWMGRAKLIAGFAGKLKECNDPAQLKRMENFLRLSLAGKVPKKPSAADVFSDDVTLN